MPQATRATDLWVLHSPDHPLVSPYPSSRRTVSFDAAESGGAIVAVTARASSPDMNVRLYEDDGYTTTCSNLPQKKTK
ncbi:hypothetical protein RRG08_021607 [Elysia crispata]|uniref:Uncharacterized protein n=1 Tax=Elysia crispata TaxID=231223 RepID=A0AAE0XDX2_9GAST|nr:hypothetical protein RRG08_021607 [Elysia crispata]